MELGGDTKAVLLAAGLIFVWALALGVYKYKQIVDSPESVAHPYTDIAHRAALLYSFAALLIAVFVELSGFPILVNLIGAFVPIAFFVAAIAGYQYHGIVRDTENQMHGAGAAVHLFMLTLIIGEIGGFTVLLAGFVTEQL